MCLSCLKPLPTDPEKLQGYGYKWVHKVGHNLYEPEWRFFSLSGKGGSLGDSKEIIRTQTVYRLGVTTRVKPTINAITESGLSSYPAGIHIHTNPESLKHLQTFKGFCVSPDRYPMEMIPIVVHYRDMVAWNGGWEVVALEIMPIQEL